VLITAEQLSVFAVLIAALGLFVWGRWRYDLVALSALLVLTCAGIVPLEEAFAGFGHPAVITVASVLIIGRTVYRSGVIEVVADRVSRATKHNSVQVLLLTGLVGICSAIMNNVAALTLLMPVAIHSAEKANRPISQVLMPLSFASLLGGLTTLMGTPPNIIIANYRAEIAGEPFAVFDFTPVGLGTAIVGIAFISFVGWRLIPERHQKSADSNQLFEISDYVSEARIPARSSLIGAPLREFAQRAKIDISVVALIRRGRNALAPDLSTILQENDVLILEGDPRSLQTIGTRGDLEIVGEKISKAMLQSEDVVLIEAVISPGSWLVDQRASPARFRRLHRANLLAVSRNARPVWRGLRDLHLRIGDVLLLQGHKDTLPDVLAYLGCLPLAERERVTVRQHPSLMPIGLFGAGIAAAVFNIIPVHVSFAVTALVLVLLGSLPLREVYASIDWPIIVLIGALLPVGAALQSTGATEVIAQFVLNIAQGWPLLLLLGLLIGASMMLSDIINNAAAAIVMAPLAITIAEDIGVVSDPFLMAVAIGCSCTFLTPIGHQSNTLVMGPGGYRFDDYWRMGLPLDLIILVVATGLTYLVWGR